MSKSKKSNRKLISRKQAPKANMSDMAGQAVMNRVEARLNEKLTVIMQHIGTISTAVNVEIDALTKVLEEKSILSEDEVQIKAYDIEDKMINFVEIEEVVKGSKLRLEYQIKTQDAKDFPDSRFLILDSIGEENDLIFSLDVQEKLMGAKKGDELDLEREVNGTKFDLKAKVLRVSGAKQEKREETNETESNE